MTLALADYRMAVRAEALTLAVADAAASYTRATTATYHDVNGVVQTAAIDAARAAHYVDSTLTPLYESAATNLCRNAEAFDQWTQLGGAATANTVAAPDGATTADTVYNVGGSVTGRIMRAVVFTGNGTKCVSCYLKENTTNRPTGLALLANGVTVIRRVRVTWVAGVPTLSSVTGTGTLHAVVALANGWHRVSFNADSYTATGDDWMTIYPWDTCDGTNDSSGVYAWGAQVEEASAPTSYIPTVAAAVTRAADVNGVFGATATGYTRASGSFITDGFRPGMEVTPTGFTASTRRVVTAVAALTLTVNTTALAVQSLASGRTLTVGMPATRTYENLDAASSIVAPAPWTAEKFLPGTTVQDTIGPFGWLEITALYQVDFHVTRDAGPAALDRYADALTRLLAPRASMTTDGGTIVRVLGAIQRSPILPSEKAGYSSVSLSFPLRVWTPNTI